MWVHPLERKCYADSKIDLKKLHTISEEPNFFYLYSGEWGIQLFLICVGKAGLNFLELPSNFEKIT